MNSRLPLNSHLPEDRTLVHKKPDVIVGTVLSSTTELLSKMSVL